jgi:hypothetical protein
MPWQHFSFRVRTCDTHWIKGCVDPIVSPNAEARRKMLCPARDQSPASQSIVRHYIDIVTLSLDEVYYIF